MFDQQPMVFYEINTQYFITLTTSERPLFGQYTDISQQSQMMTKGKTYQQVFFGSFFPRPIYNGNLRGRKRSHRHKNIGIFPGRVLRVEETTRECKKCARSSLEAASRRSLVPGSWIEKPTIVLLYLLVII